MNLTHFSLFTGIGGLDLAAEWAGFETVGQCEWADYPTKVLEKHWANVERWRDIRDVTKEDFIRRTGLRSVDIISGGFPCQPFSVNGKRKGEDDDRYLWDEMLRVISEIKPTWVIGENVAGIISLALDKVCSDLEAEGFQVQPIVLPASSAGALHRRDRVFFLAHSTDNRCEHTKYAEGKSNRKSGERKSTPIERNLAVDEGKFREQVRTAEFVRTANGIPNRMDRIKCLGNAVVPQQAYPIFKAIADIELTT
jgi:DNA (cytosine-5)-methyltransferase 1